jgi:hypothetical protein
MFENAFVWEFQEIVQKFQKLVLEFQPKIISQESRSQASKMAWKIPKTGSLCQP